MTGFLNKSHSCLKQTKIFKFTDLTDVISDPLGTENIQGVLVSVVMSLSQLKGLLVAQLKRNDVDF